MVIRHKCKEICMPFRQYGGGNIGYLSGRVDHHKVLPSSEKYKHNQWPLQECIRYHLEPMYCRPTKPLLRSGDTLLVGANVNHVWKYTWCCSAMLWTRNRLIDKI